MSDSVVDIIHNLSFNVVGEENLNRIIANFQNQAKQIDILTRNLERMKAAKANANDVSAERAYQKQIDNTTTTIQNQTNALNTAFQTNTKIQQQLKVETGLISQLTNRIKELNAARAQAQTPAVIGGINKELLQAKTQLAELTNIYGGGAGGKAGGGILASLFGGGNTARQLITGSLIGIGFGSGLGLITRAVSGLIEYAESELDSTKKAEELQKANEQLNSSFDKLGESIEKVNRIEQILNENEIQHRLGIDLSTEAYKNKVDAIKAAGEANQEAYEQDLKIFNASQDQRELERQDLDKKYKLAVRIEQTLTVARNNAGVAQAPYLGLEGDARNSQVDAAIKTVQGSLLPQKDQTDLITALNKAKDEHANILEFLDQQSKSYGSKRVEAERLLDNKSAEIQQATYDRQRKYNEQVFELDEKLSRDLLAQKEKYNQERIKSDESYNLSRVKDNAPDARNITEAADIQRNAAKQSNALETAERLRVLANQREDERRKLNIPYGDKLPDNIENDFSAQRTQIIKEQGQKQNEAIRSIHQAELKELRDFIDNQIKTVQAQEAFKRTQGVNELSVFAGQSKGRADNGLPDYDNIIASQDNAQLAEEESVKLHYIEMNKLYTDNKAQLSLLTEERDEALLQIDMKYYRLRLDAAAEYFAKLSQEITSVAHLQLTQKNTSILQGRNGLFGKSDAQAVAGAKSSIDTDNRLIPGATDAVNSDKEDAVNAPTSEKTKAATDQAIKDEQKLADIQNDQTKAQQALHDIQVKHTVEEIDAFQSLVDSTVKGYDVISEARQKDLDREISTRTQRVDLAEKLAERGNTTALALEQNALNKAQQQKRTAALQEQEVNAALTVSNSIVAVAKAAATGAGAIVLVPLIIATLATGFAEANALSTAQKSSFAKGVIGLNGPGTETSDSIPANLSKGESVITAAGTKKHRSILERINKGLDPYETPREAHLAKSVGGNSNAFVTKGELQAHGEMIVDAINGKTINVSQNVDKRGVAQIVHEERVAHNNKWR